jgi:hypothetical protein
MINKVMVMSVLCWKGLQINMEITLMHQLKNSCRCCNKGSAAIQGNCYICRLWNTPETMAIWHCTQCHMPLCKEDRSKSDRIGHSSCIETHLEASSNEHYGCKGQPLDRHTSCPPGTKGLWIYRAAQNNDDYFFMFL